MFRNEIKVETKIFEIGKHTVGGEMAGNWDWNTDELDKLLNNGWKISNTIGNNKVILIKRTGVV